jgi:hypothetical protein
LLAPVPAKGPSGDDELDAPEVGSWNASEIQEVLQRNLSSNNWRVNGVTSGNSSVGTITLGFYYDDKAAAFREAYYVAPVNLPSPNPVTVCFEITVGKQKMIATALITILPRQDHWVGDSQITQGDGSKVRSDFTFAAINIPGVNAAGTTKRQYEILNGMVRYSGPKTTGSGCALSIKPSTHMLEQKEGTLVVDTSNPNQWLISGQGEAVWLATYITYCPNGAGTQQMGLNAGWWPPNPFQLGATTAVDIVPGKMPDVVIKVNGPMGQGTVHLKYTQIMK